MLPSSPNGASNNNSSGNSENNNTDTEYNASSNSDNNNIINSNNSSNKNINENNVAASPTNHSVPPQNLSSNSSQKLSPQKLQSPHDNDASVFYPTAVDEVENYSSPSRSKATIVRVIALLVAVIAGLCYLFIGGNSAPTKNSKLNVAPVPPVSPSTPSQTSSSSPTSSSDTSSSSSSTHSLNPTNNNSSSSIPKHSGDRNQRNKSAQQKNGSNNSNSGVNSSVANSLSDAPQAKSYTYKNGGNISGIPSYISIPSIGLYHKVYPRGLTNGILQPNPYKINWYTGSVKPGSTGYSVLFGHVTYSGPDVFYYLNRVPSGGKITITYSTGGSKTFTVYKRASINKNALTRRADIWGKTSDKVLVLISCDKNSSWSGLHHVNNYVVWAK